MKKVIATNENEILQEILDVMEEMISSALCEIEICKKIDASNSYGAGVACGEVRALKQIKRIILTGSWWEE